MRKKLLFAFVALVLVFSGYFVGYTTQGRQVTQFVQESFTIGTVEAAGTSDYICDGTDDDVQFQAALNALPTSGGRITFIAGNYVFGASVTRAINNVTFEGVGLGSNIAYAGGMAISAGVQSSWVFRNFRCDSNDVDTSSATRWLKENLYIGTDYIAYDASSDWGASDFDLPSGRGATITLAAYNSTDVSKAQADYVCDYSADNVQIQAACDTVSAAGGGEVRLLEGDFHVDSTIIPGSAVALVGTNREGTRLQGTGSCTGAVIKIAHDTGKQSIRDMLIHANSTSGVACIYVERTTGQPPNFLDFRNLQLYGANFDVNSYAIKIDEMTRSEFSDIKIIKAANGILYYDNQAHGSGNSLFRNIYITLNTTNGVGLEMDDVHQIQCDHFEIIGDGIATGQRGVKLYGSKNCLFSNFDIEGVRYPVMLYSAGTGARWAQDNTFIRGYFASNVNNGIGIYVQATAYRNKFYDCTLDGITGGGSTGVKDYCVLVDQGTLYERCYPYGFDALTEWGAGCTAITRDCVNFVAPGETKTISGSLSQVAQNGAVIAWQNPFSQPGLVSCLVRITTPGGAAATGPMGLTTSAVIENCEDTWNESVSSDVTSTLSTTDYKRGSGSAQMAVLATISNGEIISTEAVSPKDMSPYTHLMFWIKSSEATASGDLEFLVDEDASCVSPSETLSLPALSASTWTLVVLPFAAAGATRDAVISVGLEYNANKKANVINVDDVRAVTIGSTMFTAPDINASSIYDSLNATDGAGKPIYMSAKDGTNDVLVMVATGGAASSIVGTYSVTFLSVA